MKKTLILSALIIFSFTGCLHNNFNYLLDTSVSIIEAAKIGGKRGKCSGVIISSKQEEGLKKVKILTAGHCVRRSNFFIIKFYDKTFTMGTKEKVDQEQDIAIINTTTSIHTKTKVIKLAKKHPKLGDTVYCMGGSSFHQWILHKGIISKELQKVSVFPKAQMTRYNIIALPGISGAGIFNEDFELIGIMNVIWPDYQSAGVSYTVIKKFLQENYE